jgi:hypothetical protein
VVLPVRREQQEFITTLNALLPGLALDLPSEAEWEYACRAGTITPYSFGETIDRSQVNFESDGPLPVGSLPPNRWGLHEMHGNVWEWCADTWHDSYEGAPTNGSAWVHPDSDPGAAYRVIRGGSWFDVARSVRAACRRLINPSRRNDFIGFRCARVQAASTASGAEQVAAPADSASRPGAERGRPQEPTGDATLLRVSESVVCFAPRIGTMLIRSDLTARS